jgi:endo-1,4-beta-xylanase
MAGRPRRAMVVAGLGATILGGAGVLATAHRKELAGPGGGGAGPAAPRTAVPPTPTPGVSLEPGTGVPVLPEDRPAAFRLGGAAAREARLEVAEVVPLGEAPAGQALRVRTTRRPPNPYDVQLTAKTVAPVETDDVLLATCYLRGAESAAETGEARTSIVFEVAAEPYTKSLQLQVDAGNEWRRIDMPFKSRGRYGAGQAQVNFQLGFGAQTIEIGGVSVRNFGKRVRLQDLPATRFTYPGREAHASWRAGAAQRIEAIRKAELTVTVRAGNGQPVPGATVGVKQRRHAFGFGSAVAAAGITGAGADNQRYRELIPRLFSKVVLENDLKWPNWEDTSQRNRTLQAMRWLHEQGLPVRGHTLVWPAWRYLPQDLRGLRHDPGALRQRVQDHILDEAGALQGQLAEWDVVNEPALNHDLMDILGQDVMVEWFRLARQADPDARLFLNEATAPGEGGRQDAFEQTLRFLIEAGAPLDGLGFQCHFGWGLTPPEQLLRGLDRFARLGKAIQVTEFDVDVTDEELQADYTRDFLTAVFSHPAVDTLMTWGFWEGRHWRPEAALVRRDWTLKPNGQVWLELVTRTWWTEAEGQTDRSGVYRTRGFLGEYGVDVAVDGRVESAQVTLPRGGVAVEISLLT